MSKPPLQLTAGFILAGVLCAQNESAENTAELRNLAIKNKLGLEMAAQLDQSSTQYGLVGGIVQNAPFSADGSTESIQVLGDGTRLRHQTAFSVARDTAGRISRQQNGETVFVFDPVANAGFRFDPVQKTAQKVGLTYAPKLSWLAMGSPFDTVSRNPASPPVIRGINYLGLKSLPIVYLLKVLKDRNVGLAIESRYDAAKVQRVADVLKELLAQSGYPNATIEVRLDPSGPTGVSIIFVVYEDKATASPQGQPDDALRKTEGLGARTIEGIAAEGTRVTTTIPIGTIGNDRPILVVAERWYSPELLINLRTERHDPRTGDVIFQLTNIRRTAPPHSLFEIPSGYTIKTR